MKSLYGKYIEEFRGLRILETDVGFVSYEIRDNHCYIADIFVVKEARNTGIAQQMCLEVGSIARDAGCKTIFGSVDPNGKLKSDGMKLMLSMGMELVSVNNGLIFFAMDL